MNRLEAVIFELWLTQEYDELLHDHRMGLTLKLSLLRLGINHGVVYPTPTSPEWIDPDAAYLRRIDHNGVWTGHVVAARSVNDILMEAS